MQNIIVGLLGFDFIKNKTVRGIVRTVVTAGLAVAATTPAGAAIIGALGVPQTTYATAAAVLAALGGIEGVRGMFKHSDTTTK